MHRQPIEWLALRGLCGKVYDQGHSAASAPNFSKSAR